MSRKLSDFLSSLCPVEFYYCFTVLSFTRRHSRRHLFARLENLSECILVTFLKDMTTTCTNLLKQFHRRCFTMCSVPHTSNSCMPFALPLLTTIAMFKPCTQTSCVWRLLTAVEWLPEIHPHCSMGLTSKLR